MYLLEEWADTFFFCVAVMHFFEIAEAVDDKSNPPLKERTVFNGDAMEIQKLNPIEIDYSTVSEGVGMKSAANICFVLLGLIYAFPTAHHGLHVTFYYMFLHLISGFQTFSDDEINGRVGGSIIGAIMAIVLYWSPAIWDMTFSPMLDSIYKMMWPNTADYDSSKSKPTASRAFKGQSWLYTKIDQQRGDRRYHAVA